MIKLGAIADIQYADFEDSENRHYRDSLCKLLKAMGDMRAQEVEYVLQFGDFIQEGWNNHQAIIEIFNMGQKNGIKWRHILGNHDFLVPDHYKKQIYENLGLTHCGFYNFSIIDNKEKDNNWHFIVLNGNEISSYAAEDEIERTKADEEYRKYKLHNNILPQPWNGSLSQTQLEWLDQCLFEASEKNEKVIICSHFPVFAKSTSIKHPNSELASQFASLINLDVYFSDLGISTWNGRKIIEIMDKYPCVKGYFAGHLHEGAFGIRKKVAHITFNGVIQTNPNAYSIIELSPHSITIKGQEAQPSYRHAF